uniref:Uncharacterized protein n=1 Tax=Panagrellus redivivus TaxID=6233 RepID=A0A7E4VFE4_PANRE
MPSMAPSPDPGIAWVTRVRAHRELSPRTGPSTELNFDATNDDIPCIIFGTVPLFPTQNLMRIRMVPLTCHLEQVEAD